MCVVVWCIIDARCCLWYNVLKNSLCACSAALFAGPLSPQPKSGSSPFTPAKSTPGTRAHPNSALGFPLGGDRRSIASPSPSTPSRPGWDGISHRMGAGGMSTPSSGLRDGTRRTSWEGAPDSVSKIHTLSHTHQGLKHRGGDVAAMFSPGSASKARKPPSAAPQTPSSSPTPTPFTHSSIAVALASDDVAKIDQIQDEQTAALVECAETLSRLDARLSKLKRRL